MTKMIYAVIAAFNEEKNISEVLVGVKKHLPKDHIIVVDDGSSDNTSDVALEEGVYVLRNIINLGKGSALKTGCDFALKHDADIIVVLDADNQHDPDDIPRFLEKIKEFDVVFGYRSFNKNMPFVFRIGNMIIKYATKVLYGIDLKDSQCGYRAYTTNAYKKVRWTVPDYSLESEVIANVCKYKLKYVEIPIETIYNDKYKETTM